MIPFLMTAPVVQPAAAPARRWPEGWACGLAGSAGAATLLTLIAAGALAPGPGLAGVGLVAAATAGLVWRVRQEAAAEAGGRPAALEAILEALPNPLMVIVAGRTEDSSGARVVFANAAAQAALDVRPDGSRLVNALRIPEVWEIVDEALVGRAPGETTYESGSAQDRYWRAFTRPLPDGADGSRLALLIIRDDTDARRNERMRSDFLANASHELRTPLASLAGFIETLRGHARNDEAARDRFLGIMADQADRMSRLVADLLSLSRIELNEHILPEGQVDLAMAAMDVIDALAPQAKMAGVALEHTLPPRGSATVVGDRDQILQVIQNLVDNGLKYAGPGGQVRIEVTPDLTESQALTPRGSDSARLSLLNPDRARGRYAVVRVEDTGPGIAREHLPRLTERFYRVEGQKSGERLGTGLGLAIVKHITKRHRGGLAVESMVGRGTAFLAYFPTTQD
jgi:two-component system, OmpR family, phosphate regulon sensor histidine kinase PhoR